MNLRIGFFLLLIGLLSATKVNAQQEQRWEDCYAELIGMEGESEEDIPDYDLLCDIANHPININQATKEDLEQLPFLSDQQIEDVMEYLFRYHSMQSLGELYMIPSLGYT
ncbi:MAG: helix-hairpin-helix domain-containing protein, partial [Segatella salivae]